MLSVYVIEDSKIGILSDTHGSFPAWKRALELFGPEVKTVLHAGDVLYHGPRNSIPGGYTPADLSISTAAGCSSRLATATRRWT